MKGVKLSNPEILLLNYAYIYAIKNKESTHPQNLHPGIMNVGLVMRIFFQDLQPGPAQTNLLSYRD